MQSSDFAGVYRKIAELFDIEIVEKIYENFRGRQIVFPQRLYLQEYITKNNPVSSAKEATFKEDMASIQDELSMYISKKYTDGESIRELAKKYGYSERWIRKLING